MVVGVGEEKVVGWLAEGYGGVDRTGHTARILDELKPAGVKRTERGYGMLRRNAEVRL